ncbi:CHRD domain-containing protein [Kribbella sp. VKM Ac-2566]|uniref:CHRD domain-containing protein n=1 Tax=Kribbella sp. VKM Ac-2566 TaxID=2512218 RepID=UPI001062D131|nr:CHRD domain-containing protein [Kribbella sp. VKM Ac-2566]TDX03869.1 CHRD domain-containing protein [Kribbella sp. VKM Ac-2566]
MSVRTTIAATAAVLAAAAFGMPAASAAPAIPLNGGQEAAAADPDGHGFFTYTIEGTTFCWTLSWHDIEPATAAHVHLAPRNVAGPVVIPLSVAANPGSGCTTISADLAAGITADPKAYYVNIHTATFPAGAIRGQLK